MPEGPSIVILKEELVIFKNKIVLEVGGNTKLEIQRLQGQKIIDFKSWGKQLLICFKNFTVRIHLLMFGSYRINEHRENMQPRLWLKFKNGEVNFYSCAVKFIEGDLSAAYDWEADTMSHKWNATKALKSLNGLKDTLVCDALLDQNIFAGSGNIIKNEVLFRIRTHPESLVNKLPRKKLVELIKETRNYCFEFYEWKKKFELRKHWQVYRQKFCPRCNLKLSYKHLGIHKRRSFFCSNCQVLYD